MKYLLYILFFVGCSSYNSIAQNLVPNPGFEYYSYCPRASGMIECPLIPGQFRKTLNDWNCPIPTSADYYNACSVSPDASVPNNYYGYHPAHTGDAYAGIFASTMLMSDPPHYNSEYLQCKLIRPLVAGLTYDVSCYVKLVFLRDSSNQNKMAVKNIGALFSDTMIVRSGSSLPFYGVEMTRTDGNFITDTSEWVKILASYVAKGGEQYMILGGHYGGNLPPWALVYPTWPHGVNEYISYYIIDDVELISREPCDTITYNHDTTICDSNMFPLTLKSSNDTAVKYWWTTFENTPSVKVGIGGEYTCIASKGCNAVVDNFRISYIPGGMLANLLTPIQDSTICKGKTYTLGKQYHYPFTYKWNTGDSACCITVSTPGKYILTISTPCDSLTDTADIRQTDCEHCIFVPDAFTPNNDRLNDNFGATALCGINSFTMRIYNRWGQEVFHADNINKRWNGMHLSDLAEMGSYYYYIEYSTVHDSKIMLKKGDITLLR